MSIHSSRQVSISTLYPQQYTLQFEMTGLLIGWLVDQVFSSPLTEHTDCSLLITLLELNLNQRLYSKGQWTCSVLIGIFCGKILGISPHQMTRRGANNVTVVSMADKCYRVRRIILPIGVITLMFKRIIAFLNMSDWHLIV